MPVWGLRLDDRVYSSTGLDSRKARNLRANAAAAANAGSGEL